MLSDKPELQDLEDIFCLFSIAPATYIDNMQEDNSTERTLVENISKLETELMFHSGFRRRIDFVFKHCTIRYIVRNYGYTPRKYFIILIGEYSRHDLLYIESASGCVSEKYKSVACANFFNEIPPNNDYKYREAVNRLLELYPDIAFHLDIFI